MELQGWQRATRLLLKQRKSFVAAQIHRLTVAANIGGTPFADTGRGGCDPDPITTFNMV